MKAKQRLARASLVLASVASLAVVSQGCTKVYIEERSQQPSNQCYKIEINISNQPQPQQGPGPHRQLQYPQYNYPYQSQQGGPHRALQNPYQSRRYIDP